MIAATGQTYLEQDYLVFLETEPDSWDTIRQRSVSVSWDDGVEIDWTNWLEWYNHHECAEFRIVKII